MNLLQINVTANWGSHGKIAEAIGDLVLKEGGKSYMAYGRGNPTSSSKLIRIGSDFDMRCHGVSSRLFDNHGLCSVKTTKEFISKIPSIKPDIIHLHNIHGYYLNYEILFDFLKKWGGPVVWTLHDCWPFTGHCAYYDFVQCDKWQSHCCDCPQKTTYPASLWSDRSFSNFDRKNRAFSDCPNLTLIPVSYWLETQLGRSFLSSYEREVIHNGVDLDTFHPLPRNNKGNQSRRILGVASVWEKRKGLEDFVKLAYIMPSGYKITLIGLTEKQIKTLPPNIEGITRTDNVGELVKYYSDADVFVNPTWEDNFPTTNLEALACGTPVVTYNTGGSPEAVDRETGVVVNKGNILGLREAIENIIGHPDVYSKGRCRERAEQCFDRNVCFAKYIELYHKLSI